MANPSKYHLRHAELNLHREEADGGEEEVSEVVAAAVAALTSTLKEETGPVPTVRAAT